MRVYRLMSLLLVSVAQVAMGSSRADAFSLAWRQPIVGTTSSGRLYRVEISAEMYDRCREFPADIRIRDTAQGEWPFFIWSPPRADEITVVRTEQGARVGGKGDGKPLILDLKVRADIRGQYPRHNQISLITAGHDFIRRVEVLGSEDGRAWKDLGRGYLVDHLQEAHVSNRIISYEETALPFLKFFIFPNAGNNRERIDLIDVQASLRTDPSADLRSIALEPQSVPPAEVRTGVQSLVYRTGATHRPIEHLHLIMEGDRFTFPVRVYGRNSETNPWLPVADGGVYRVGGQSRELIDLHGAAFRFLKLDIYHYEQTPAAVRSVLGESLPRMLIFEPASDLPAFVQFGGDRVPLPRYDLQFRTPAGAFSNAIPLSLGEARVNPSKIAMGLATFGRSLVWLLLCVCFFLFMVFILRRWRMGGA